MNKISRDVLFSSLFAVAAVVLNFWLIREAEFYLSATMLGTFLLIRRVAPTFSNLTQFGTSQALIRFTSINNKDENKIRTYYFLAFVNWLLATIILGLLYVYLADPFIRLLLPNTESGDQYLLITLVYISILHLSYLILPYYLNQRKIVAYNIVNIIISCLVMLVVFLFWADEMALAELLKISLFVMGGIQLVIAAIIIYKLRILAILKELKMVRKEALRFFTYGIPRAGMTFLEMFMLTVGSLMVKTNYEVVGSFLIAITLARVILIILQPLSLLSSVIVGHNQEGNKQTKTLNLLMGGIVYTSIPVVILLYNWIDVLMPLWLKNPRTIMEVTSIFRILIFGLIPYCIFQGLKGYIEIRFFKPVNLFTLAIGTGVHIVLYLVLKSDYGVMSALSISLMLAFILMGVLSLAFCRSELYKMEYFGFISMILVSFVIFSANYFAAQYFDNLMGLGAAVVFTLMGYGLYLIYYKSKFIEDLLKTLNIPILNRIFLK